MVPPLYGGIRHDRRQQRHDTLRDQIRFGVRHDQPPEHRDQGTEIGMRNTGKSQQAGIPEQFVPRIAPGSAPLVAARRPGHRARHTLRPSPNWQYLRPSRKIRRKSPARDRRSRKRPISAPAHPAGRGNGQSRNRAARLARQHGSSAGSHRNSVHTLSPDTASYRPPRRSAPGENAPTGQPSATYNPLV